MYYWYNPYLVHGAYPPSVQHIVDRRVASGDMTALPSGTSPLPPVNITQFHKSAKYSLELMKQANLLVTKISESDPFANELMSSAQNSNQKKVDEMITSAGITAKFKTQFTPGGIRITIQNESEEGKCCQLVLILHW